MSTLASVGKVSKLFGLGGEVIINLYDTFPEDINTGEPLFARIDSLTVPLFLEKFERRGRSGALVRFGDFETPERASMLLGMELFTGENGPDTKTLSENDDDEFYFEDFAGFTAFFEGYDISGTIDSFIEHEHNPLFALSIDGKEAFIPATEELISSFDPAKREITFSLPEGLLELYIQE